MKNRTTIAVGLLTIAAAPFALSYELTTHAAITYNAYLQSRLATDRSIARDLGIDWYMADPGPDRTNWRPDFGSTDPFNKTYIDTNPLTGNDAKRDANDFERKIILNTLGVPVLTVPGWLMRGAVREDDSGKIFGVFGIGASGEPYDDPYANFNRWCNHFFDPTKSEGNRKANFPCPDTYQDAPNWAVGSQNAFVDNSGPYGVRRNHFTVQDAREAMYRAVTGRKSDGGGAGAGGNDADFAMRKSYWSTVFRSLGDVLHLNQDMAQPQHTRNESHAGIGAWAGLSILGNPVFEKYMDARASGAASISVYGTTVVPAPLSFGGYAPPRFTRFSDYWSTAPGQTFAGGQGLADFSNRNFFTVGNNYGGTTYVYPQSVPELYSRITSTITVPGPVNKIYSTTHLVGTVSDTQAGGSHSARLTKESAWKDLTNNTESVPAYTMDRGVFDDMAGLLMPRAVGYSAGLLDFFFRGKMKIELPEAGGAYGIVDHSKVSIGPGELLTNFKGFGKIKIKLSAPDTGNDGQAQAFTGGKVLGVVKFRRNKCYDKNLSQFVDLDQGTPPKYESCRTVEEEVVVSDPAEGGAPIALNSTPKEIALTFAKAVPLNATDIRLQVIYRGTLGTENNAVVVATQDLSEPTYFSYINASDYSTIQTATGVKVYTRSEINASQALLEKVFPQSCVDKNVWQLKPGCLESFNLRLGVKIGTNTADVTALPVRRFVRLAFLGTAETQVNLAQFPENTCYPHDPFEVDTVEWQDNADPSNQPTVSYPEFQKVRGVWGWYGTSCVQNGDGLTPGTAADNRDEVMTDLSESEMVPFELILKDKDGNPLDGGNPM
jgi:hypothetical protein